MSTIEPIEDSTEALKLQLIAAGRKAVKELIKVAEDNILKKTVTKSQSKKASDKDEITDTEADAFSLSSDRLKNAAAAKKMAIFDGFDILNKIDTEEALIIAARTGGKDKLSNTKGFAEQHSS
tara:strand:+ start:1450 stop:1818 length:369 start_codon:yes stop_codon:yes gene_type:complete